MVRPLPAVTLALLAVAPLVSAGRALLALVGSEPPWYWILFAVGGTLSGLGMLGTAWATWRRRAFAWVLAGAAVALLGHNVVGRIDQIAPLGPALVHVGTGTVLWPWVRLAPVAGTVAGLGAVLRTVHPVGHAFLLLGSMGLFAAVVLAVRVARSGPSAPDRVPPGHGP